MRWVASGDCESNRVRPRRCRTSTACSSPAVSASGGSRAKIGAIRYARQRGVQCWGTLPRVAVHRDQAARSVGLTEASSAEFDPDTPDPVIATMADQEHIVAGEADLGGTMRLGAYPAVLGRFDCRRGLRRTNVSERHRHRYEVNNTYRDKIAESGLRFSGTSPDGHLIGFVEYPREVHPYLVGTQAHPSSQESADAAASAFSAFIGAAIAYKAEERLPLENLQRSSGSEHAPKNQPARLNTNSTSSRATPPAVGNIPALRIDGGPCRWGHRPA